MSIHELYDRYLQHPSVQTDTRRLQAGDLFFALKGDNFNGNTFAMAALAAGAAYAIIDEAPEVPDDRLIQVDDVLTTLQQLAAHHRLQLDIPVIAITGSNGKTTTKELLTTVLSTTFRLYATEGNLNNHIGVPLTLLKIQADAELAIVEMGANHEGEIAAYCQMAFPNYGIINNVGKAHLEGFGDLAGVRRAKGELYDYLRLHEGAVFRNADLPYLAEMAQGISQQITYGTANAQVIGRAIDSDPYLSVAMLSSGLETQINTRLAGAYNLPNVLAAIAVGHYFNIDIDTMKRAIEAYTPSNSRSQWMEKGTNRIILDAYNANPTSMKLALENLADMKADNKWVLLGTMKEMGAASLAEHQALIDQAVALGLKQVLLCGPEYAACDHDFTWFEEVGQLTAYLKAHPITRATVLIKGSRGARMEQVLAAFEA